MTVVPGVKPVPLKVIAVLPLTGPVPGEIPVKVGATATYVKPAVNVALATPLFTVTFFTKEPLTYAGVVAVMVLAFTTLIFVAATPAIVTVVAGVKFVPTKVTAVPPVMDPVAGLILTKVGALA